MHLMPSAVLKLSLVTAMALRISASMFSSSRSITSIFSRMHCSAASVHSAARSAPTYPCVSCARTGLLLIYRLRLLGMAWPQPGMHQR